VLNRIEFNSANGIRFLRLIKEMIKHYTIIRRYKIVFACSTFWRQ